MRLVAFIAEASVAKRILDRLGLVSTRPPVAKHGAPDGALDPGPEYDDAGPSYDE